MRTLTLVVALPLAALALHQAVARSPRPRLVHETPPRPRPAQPPPWLGNVFASAQLEPPSTALLAGWFVLVGAVTLGLAWRVGLLFGVGVGAVLALGPPATLFALRGRRQQAIEAELATFLEAVARGLRSGLAPQAAVRESLATVTGPLHDDVAALVATVDLGATLGAALARWRATSHSSGVTLAVAALSLGAMAGGARAQAVDNVAATLRERAAIASEVKSLTTQARASALVMALLPLGFLALTAGGGSAAGGFLFTNPLGVACLVIGLSLELAGGAWMISLTRSVR